MPLQDFRAGPAADLASACLLRQADACRPDPMPGPLLQAFTRNMAGQGVWVSSAMMQCDRRYALRQLASAHCSDDVALRDMAMALFRDLESSPVRRQAPG